MKNAHDCVIIQPINLIDKTIMTNIKNFIFKSAAYSTAGFLTTTYFIALAKAHKESAEHAKRFPNAKPSSTYLGRFLNCYYPFLLPKSTNNKVEKNDEPAYKPPVIGPK